MKNNFERTDDVKSVLMCGKRKELSEVSFMIPTYKRAEYIKKTIDSVIYQKCVNLSYEIVIVDNDFENESILEIVKKYDEDTLAYYKNEKNIGMFGNWNKCIQLARGEWILILHDDDTVENDYLESVYEIIRRNPNIGGVACNCNYINEFDEIKFGKGKRRNIYNIIERKQFQLRHQDFYWFHPIDIFGLMINKEKAIEVGGFDERWFPAADYKFIINLFDSYGIVLTTRKIFNYRIADNESRKVDTVLKFILLNDLIRNKVNVYTKCASKRFDEWYRRCSTANNENPDNNWWIDGYSEEDKMKYFEGIKEINDILGHKKSPSNMEMNIQRIIESFMWRLVRITRIR